MNRLLIALALVAALPACSAPRIPGITPYKIDIQQGNFLSQEMVSQLKAGMSKEQVRLVLGTPLLADAFHADRWDYVYWREAPNGKRESRKLALFFSDNRLVRADGDLIPDKLPSEPASPAATQLSPAPPGQSAVRPVPEGPAAAPVTAQPQPVTPPPPPPPEPTQAPTQAPAETPTPTQAPPAQETR